MNISRRPEGRFALEALAIVAAAAIPGYLHVSWKHVLMLVVAVLILSVLIETLVALRSRRRGKSEEPAPLREDPVPPIEPEPEPEPEPVVVKEEPPPPPPTRVVEASPPPAPAPKPRPPLPPQPRPQRPVPPPAPDDVEQVVAAIFAGTPPAPPPRQPPPSPPPTGPWKIAQLERALRAQPNPDPELLYMIGYLRDYASADGTLPPEFDELVRDAFGPVLGLG